MKRVDLLRPGERARVIGNGDVAHLIRSFNEMLDRLEAERGASTARALAAHREVHAASDAGSVELAHLRKRVDAGTGLALIDLDDSG
jgi:hypothetical protein